MSSNSSDSVVDNNGKRQVCLLDVQVLMQLKPNQDNATACPACQNPISVHSESGAQEEQPTVEGSDQPHAHTHSHSHVHSHVHSDSESLQGGAKKKQKLSPVSTNAAKLVKKGKLCEATGCTSIPSFNRPDENKTRFCATHKENGMVNIKAIFCQINDCGRLANYNFDGEKGGLYCSSHKMPGMLNVRAQLCKSEGCTKIPSYNFPSESRPKYCKSHCDSGMVDVKHHTCAADGCSTRPHYNVPGEKKGKFCAVHKEAGMVSQDWLGVGVKKDYKKYMKSCEKEGCTIQPNFNFPGKKRGQFCATHKLDGMQNIHVRHRCLVESCKKHPNFNFKGEKKGIFCNDHKESGMVNVYSLKCEVDDCGRGAHYHSEGETRARRCSTHVEADMISQAKARPVCNISGCATRPTFFDPTMHSTAVVCMRHKSEGMISRNAINKRKAPGSTLVLSNSSEYSD